MAALSGCINPGYNDNPSQQVTTPRAGCPAATEFFGVFFSLHIQPLTDPQQERVRKEIFRSYCYELPMPGTIYFTADLVGNDLLTRTIGIKVVEQSFAGYGLDLAEKFRDSRTIWEIPPIRYSNGVIETQFELDNKGYYAVYLRRDGDAADSDYNVLTIPLRVGAEPQIKLILGKAALIFSLVLGALLMLRSRPFKFIRLGNS